jgi:hypothetical protein
MLDAYIVFGGLITHPMLSERCFGNVPIFCYLQRPFDLSLLTWRFSSPCMTAYCIRISMIQAFYQALQTNALLGTCI